METTSSKTLSRMTSAAAVFAWTEPRAPSSAGGSLRYNTMAAGHSTASYGQACGARINTPKSAFNF